METTEQRLNEIMRLASEFSVDDLTYLINKLNKLKKSSKGVQGGGSAEERTLPVRPPPKQLKEGRIPSSPAWQVRCLTAVLFVLLKIYY
jgi:hypothetical protein